MFDYYVDESGEWDPWQSRYDYLPGAIHEGKSMGQFAGHFSKLNKKSDPSQFTTCHICSYFFRVPEVSYFDASDLLGEVFVDTMDTVSDYLLFGCNR